VLVSFRRIARVLRLALVCFTLAWSSAPAPAASTADAIALIVGAHQAAAPRVQAEPSDRATSVRELATRASRGDSEPRTSRLTAPRAWSLPRRLYVEHQSLLC
jgi:hypothetical protein